MALAGAIVTGVARFIVMLSAQAEVFGVGTTVMVGSMVVATSCVMSGGIVPGGEFAGISGVESGKAAPLVGGPPGAELHTVVDELPSGETGDSVPVALPTMEVEIVPRTVDGIAGTGGLIAFAPRATDLESIGMGGTVMEGGGGAGTVGIGGAGTVEPKISVVPDVAG